MTTIMMIKHKTCYAMSYNYQYYCKNSIDNSNSNNEITNYINRNNEEGNYFFMYSLR